MSSSLNNDNIGEYDFEDFGVAKNANASPISDSKLANLLTSTLSAMANMTSDYDTGEEFNAYESWPDGRFTYEAYLTHYPPEDQKMQFDEANNQTFYLPFCSFCDPAPPTPDSHYVVYNMWMTGIMLPLIGVCGLIGNSISVYVFSRPKMRTKSCNLYLCILAMADIIVIATGMFLFTIEGMRRHSPFLTYYYAFGAPFLYPVAMSAQMCSVYSTMSAAIDCFIIVVPRPAYRKVICRPKVAVCVISFVVISSIGYNIPHIWDTFIVECFHQGFQEVTFQVCPSAMRISPEYIEYYITYMYSFFIAAGPLTLLIVLNSIMVTVTVFKKRRLRRHSRHKSLEATFTMLRTTMNNKETSTMSTTVPTESSVAHNGTPVHIEINGRRTSEARVIPTVSAAPLTTHVYYRPADNANNNGASSAANDGQLTVKRPVRPTKSITLDEPDDEEEEDMTTLVLVVALFIFCNTMGLAISLIESYEIQVFQSWMNYLVDVSNVLVVFNSSVNIVIYYTFGVSFRETLQEHFAYHFGKRKAHTPTNVHSQGPPNDTMNLLQVVRSSAARKVSVSPSTNSRASYQPLSSFKLDAARSTEYPEESRETMLTLSIDNVNALFLNVEIDDNTHFPLIMDDGREILHPNQIIAHC